MTNVLLIESDDEFAQQIETEIKNRNATVEIVNDGSAALQKLSGGSFQLVILAVELPRGSGYSICNKVKKDPALGKIPLIITSSKATEQTFQQHKKLKTRADAYLKKPFSMQQLFSEIGKFVDWPEATAPAGAKDAEIASPSSIAETDDINAESGPGNEQTQDADVLVGGGGEPVLPEVASEPAPDPMPAPAPEPTPAPASKPAPASQGDGALKKELAAKEKQLEVLGGKLTQIAEKAKALLAEREKYTKEKQAAEATAKEKTAENERLQAQIESLKKELAVHGESGNAAHEQISELKQQYEQQIADMQSNIQSLEEQNQSLQSSAADEKAALQASLAEAQAKVESLQSSSNDEKAEIQASLAEAQAKVESLQQEVQGLESRLNSENQKIQQAQQALSTALQMSEKLIQPLD